MLDGVIKINMRKDLILTFIFSLIQIIIVIAIKGFIYPLLLLFFMLIILSYISIEDWKTGLISVSLNIITLALALGYALFSNIELKVIGINLLLFVLPFIIIETVFQLFINKGKDEERFLIGGGDMILFATMSFILSTFNMCVMLFVACLMSITVSKIIKKSLVHFAPFIQLGFLVAFLFGEAVEKILFFNLY